MGNWVMARTMVLKWPGRRIRLHYSSRIPLTSWPGFPFDAELYWLPAYLGIAIECVISFVLFLIN
jgi:hypothetical protein